MGKREIKFRCWNGEEMLSPEYIDRKGYAHWRENSIPSITEGVMQFTGLKDKKGKDIYEGDIVEWRDSSNNKLYWIGEVKFGEYYVEYTDTDYGSQAVGAYGFYVHHPDSKEYCGPFGTDKDDFVDTSRLDDFYTVIGNIYEHPSLLSVENDGKII